MTKKYKMVRIPAEAYENFLNKKNVIANILHEEKIKKRFTMADTLRYFSKKKIFVWNNEILDFLNNKKNKRKNPSTTLI